jgi:hypothetical protein
MRELIAMRERGEEPDAEFLQSHDSTRSEATNASGPPA